KPDQQSREPQAQAQSNRRGERAVEDGKPTRSSRDQNGFGERAVERYLKPGYRNWLAKHGRYTSLAQLMRAPPAKAKNDRKNDVAAKAMESPNTIWMRRRNPPPISPKARLKPVTMMVTTATTLATGPSIDSRMRCSGASQGMPDPAAWAASPVATVK